MAGWLKPAKLVESISQIKTLNRGTGVNTRGRSCNSRG